MVFSEEIKKEVKRKAHYRCCFCEAPDFIEVHHIIPQEEGGPDTIDNAAPLCTSCHDKYGDNPKKRKALREKRDFWYDFCEKRLQKEDLKNLDKLSSLLDSSKNGGKIPLKLPTQGPTNSGLEMAKQYWLFITKGKVELIFCFILPLVISILFIQDYWMTKTLNNLLVSTTTMLIPLLQLSVIALKFNSSCPKCNSGFAITETDREFINTEKIGKDRYNNIRISYGCRFCDYKSQELISQIEEKE